MGRCSNFEVILHDQLLSTKLTQIMYLFTQNHVQRYLGAVAAQPSAGFGCNITGGWP